MARALRGEVPFGELQPRSPRDCANSQLREVNAARLWALHFAPRLR